MNEYAKRGLFFISQCLGVFILLILYFVLAVYLPLIADIIGIIVIGIPTVILLWEFFCNLYHKFRP